MAILPGDFTSLFAKYKIRKNGLWEDAPPMSVQVNPSSFTSIGVYEIIYPNPGGALNNVYEVGDTQEIFIADPQTGTMYQVFTGNINNIDRSDKYVLRVQGRHITGLLADRRITDAWQNKTIDFIICDETAGILGTLFPEFTSFNAFSREYDDFRNWNGNRWGTQPAYATLDSGILKFAGDGASTRTLSSANSYLFQFINFRIRLTSNSNTVRFGFKNAAGTQYIRFSINSSGTIACQANDGSTSQSTNTSATYTTTNYLHYRIEWTSTRVTFFVNGTQEVEFTANIPAGTYNFFMESVSSSNQIWCDYVKVITNNDRLVKYKIQGKDAFSSIEDLCKLSGISDIYIFYLDDDYDFNAHERITVSSGLQFGFNSSTYTNNVFAITNKLKGDEIKNIINVYGGEKLNTVAAPTWTDQFIGDGTTTSFALGYKANKPLTLIEVNAVAKTEDTDFFVEYGTQHTIVKFVTAPTSTHSINIRYDYYSKVYGYADSETSISSYGRKEYNYYDDNIQDTGVAGAVADGLLALKSDPRKNVVIRVRLLPYVTIGTTVYVDSPLAGINTQQYEVMQVEHSMPEMRTTLTLVSTEITSMPELFKAILKELDDLRAKQVNSDVPSLKTYSVSETLNANLENSSMTYRRVWVCDSFILGHSVNGLLGMGKIMDDFESGVTTNWSSTAFTVGASGVQYRVGAQAMSLVYVGTGTQSVFSTQSFGSCSSFTGVATGAPSTGCVGVWVYDTSGSQVSAIELELGVDSSNYLRKTGEIYGSRTSGNSQRAGWNYYIFPLASTSTVVGTVTWSTTSYAKFNINLASGALLYLDYFTISSQTAIGLNGLGSRTCTESEQNA